MSRGTAFTSNEEFIVALGSNLDLDDSVAVFRHVFSCLSTEVVVYPTENYYYFTFSANGQMVWGSLSLYAHNRDAGVLGFGYAIKTDKFRDVFRTVRGGGATLGPKDGVVVRKINDFRYSVSYEGKKVIFKLNHVPMKRPKKAKLRRDEVLVGRSFDESGLQFFLIFNKSKKCLYWMLDEDQPVLESFTDYTDEISIGDRTEYAFYVDRTNRRKILIGVEGFNVLQNNWYDGPFDQMPDNYVYTGEIEMRKYLEASYPHLNGTIDKYGNFIGRTGSRVAVAPYLVYFSRKDLLERVARSKSFHRGAAFYASLTKQTFVVPKEFRA